MLGRLFLFRTFASHARDQATLWHRVPRAGQQTCHQSAMALLPKTAARATKILQGQEPGLIAQNLMFDRALVATTACGIGERDLAGTPRRKWQLSSPLGPVEMPNMLPKSAPLDVAGEPGAASLCESRPGLDGEEDPCRQPRRDRSNFRLTMTQRRRCAAVPCPRPDRPPRSLGRQLSSRRSA